MDEEAALRAAIAADPAADLPRLVYADWLEDQGREGQAEFVRTQVQLAREPEWSPLAVRCKHFRPELLTGGPWRGTLSRLSPRVAAWHPERPFQRGLPDWLIVLDLASFLDLADRLMAETPVTTLSLPTSTLPFWQEFARRPWLRQVKSLHFFGLSTPIEPLRVLADAPNAAGVERLTLESAASPAVPVVLADLFASPLGGRLKALDLRVGGDREGEWLEGLENLPDGHPLEALDLRTMQLGEEGVYRLSGSPLFRRLERFHFRDQPLGNRAVRELLRSGRNRRRRDAALTNTNSYFPDSPPLAFGRSEQSLARLDLSDNSFIGSHEWDWPGQFHTLASLQLCRCMIGEVEYAGLTAAVPWATLVEFDLRRNRSLGRQVGLLAETPPAPNLVALHLPGHGVSAGDRARLQDHFQGAALFDDG